MAAAAQWRTHRQACTACVDDRPCEAGAPLWESFRRLQDAYFNHQRKR
ncbi:hypothetical protein ABZ778_29620 [Streptomyces bacillaris]|nr:hypothetical protein [Streptomyces sp. ZL-24]